MNTPKEVAIKCLNDEAQALQEVAKQINDEFVKAVELIYNCTGHIVVTGVGKSGHVGAKIAATLASTGTPAIYLNPLDALHGDLGMVTSKDVVLMLSNSGNTDDLLRIIASLQELEVPIVAMTGNAKSLIAKHSTSHLLVHVEREACPLNLAPTSSTTAAMAMGDALAIALMEMRKFKAKDFAKFHPGGSLGRKLVTSVRDVMYKDNFPIITPSTLLVDALIDISKGKLGLGVVMESGKIQGIITDGDIRRAAEGAKENFLSLHASDAMTRTPKTIHPNAKLTEVQAMFRNHKIHSLLVIDDNDNLVGIVDYFAIMG